MLSFGTNKIFKTTVQLIYKIDRRKHFISAVIGRNADKRVFQIFVGVVINFTAQRILQFNHSVKAFLRNSNLEIFGNILRVRFLKIRQQQFYKFLYILRDGKIIFLRKILFCRAVPRASAQIHFVKNLQQIRHSFYGGCEGRKAIFKAACNRQRQHNI